MAIWAEHVARNPEVRNLYILIGNREGNIHKGYIGVHMDNIKNV